METIEKQEFVKPKQLNQYFWDVFVIDALLGNFDRHNGNWGFLFDDELQQFKIAPVFDCGSCLLPQADEKVMNDILTNEDELNSRIFQFPTSAIKYNGRKINYYDFIMGCENKQCMEAVIRITPRIDIEQINLFIDEIPYISNLQQKFYKTYISARYEKLLLPAYQKAISGGCK